MEHPRPQLSLVELRQLRWFLGGLIGLLSAWTVFYMEVDALLTLVFLTATVPVFTLFPRLSLALPSAFHLLAFPVIVALFAFDMWSSREPLPAMVRLDLMLLCYRCVAPRRRREDLQLILLALFLVVVTGVFTVSIAFVAQILLFTAASLGMLLGVTLSDARSDVAPAQKDSASAQVQADAGWERVDWPELGRRLRRVMDVRVVALAGALFAGVVGLSAVLFMALPRFEISNDFFFDRLITKSTRTGFSDTVNFQEVVDIQQDTSVAVMIDVSDPSVVPTEPYWRMVVLDEYSGEGFRMSPTLKGTFFVNRDKSPVHDGSSGVRDDTVWTVYFQPGVSKYLPLMGAFGRMTFGEPQALQQSRPLRLCLLPSEPAKMVAYRVHGMDTNGILRDRSFSAGHVLRSIRSPDRGDHPAEEEVENEENPGSKPVTFLDLGLPREADRDLLRKWAEEIGGAGAGGGDFARRAGAWLQARHSYSLSMRLEPGDGDPLIRWMDSTQPGHCELFAGSLVMLARSAGVPARLVTGFKGGTWNATSGSITVRNSDAHAWAEVWDEELGSWLRADATPGSEITPSPNSVARGGASSLAQDSGWNARIDGLRIFWYRRIVNFDRSLQRELLRETKENLRNLIQSGRRTAEDYLRAVVEWLRAPWDFSRFAGISLGVGLVAGGIVVWRRAGRSWWMGWRSRRAASHRRDPVRIEASRWLARLDRAVRLAQAPGDAERERAGEARARLLRLRFGARSGWAPPASVFREAKQAARALARSRR
jgi:protein-glutamine gamma-glutamyltransferase